MEHMDRKKLAIKVAAGLLITSIVTLVSISVTSPGLAQVLANFNWLFALRAFAGVTAIAAVCTGFGIGIGVNNDAKYKWPAFVGCGVLLVVCVTMYAGLWR